MAAANSEAQSLRESLAVRAAYISWIVKGCSSPVWNAINAFIRYFSLKKNEFSLKKNDFSFKKNGAYFSLKKNIFSSKKKIFL